MKSCIQCGTEAADDAHNCPKCGREFTFKGAAGGQPQAVQADATEARPDGRSQIWLGWIGLVVGGIFLILSFATDIAPYGQVDPDAVARQWNMLIGGAGLMNVGFFLLLVGLVVRAIWFLPGRDV